MPDKIKRFFLTLALPSLGKIRSTDMIKLILPKLVAKRILIGF